MMNNIFVVDRPILNTHAYLWMAATNAQEVRYSFLPNMVQVDTEDESLYRFTDRILKTIDLLRGVRFTVPVKDFRLWKQTETGEVTLYDLTGLEPTAHVQFPEPIAVCAYPHETFMISYSFEPEKEGMARLGPGVVHSNYRLLDPMYEVTLLNNERRKAVQLATLA